MSNPKKRSSQSSSTTQPPLKSSKHSNSSSIPSNTIQIPLKDLPKNHIRVRKASKIKNLVQYALKLLKVKIII